MARPRGRHEPFRIRDWLVGTRVAEANGSDYTDRYLDECQFAVGGAEIDALLGLAIYEA